MKSSWLQNVELTEPMNFAELSPIPQVTQPSKAKGDGALFDELTKPVAVVGIDEKAVLEGFDRTAPTQHGVMVLILNGKVNRFWQDQFYTCWAKALEKDVIQAGQYAVDPKFTAEQRHAHSNNVYDLQRRIHSPRESHAPTFRDPAPAHKNSKPVRLFFSLEPVHLYGGLQKYAQRVIEVIDATNAALPSYQPLLTFIENEKKQQRALELQAIKAKSVIEQVAQVLESKRFDATTSQQ